MVYVANRRCGHRCHREYIAIASYWIVTININYKLLKRHMNLKLWYPSSPQSRFVISGNGLKYDWFQAYNWCRFKWTCNKLQIIRLTMYQVGRCRYAAPPGAVTMLPGEPFQSKSMVVCPRLRWTFKKSRSYHTDLSRVGQSFLSSGISMGCTK